MIMNLMNPPENAKLYNYLLLNIISISVILFACCYYYSVQSQRECITGYLEYTINRQLRNISTEMTVYFGLEEWLRMMNNGSKNIWNRIKNQKDAKQLYIREKMSQFSFSINLIVVNREKTRRILMGWWEES